MNAIVLKGQVTRDRQLLIEIPEDMTPGAVEVILLRRTPLAATRRRTRRTAAHPAFGVWAKRTDITDSASFAGELRPRVEMRADGANGR